MTVLKPVTVLMGRGTEMTIEQFFHSKLSQPSGMNNVRSQGKIIIESYYYLGKRED